MNKIEPITYQTFLKLHFHSFQLVEDHYPCASELLMPPRGRHKETLLAVVSKAACEIKAISLPFFFTLGGGTHKCADGASTV